MLPLDALPFDVLPFDALLFDLLLFDALPLDTSQSIPSGISMWMLSRSILRFRKAVTTSI